MAEPPTYSIRDISNISALLFNLQGTKVFEAYWELFPDTHPDPRVEYRILNDKTNRLLLEAIYSNGKLDAEGLAENLSLDSRDVKKRIDFFKANGMRQDL